MMGKDLSGNGREKAEPSLEGIGEVTESVSTPAGGSAHGTVHSPPRQHTAMTTTLILMPENPVQAGGYQLRLDDELLHGRVSRYQQLSRSLTQPSSSTQTERPSPTTTGITHYHGHMIPDIVIEPIPPRDSFGHSHTPPLVQRQWGLSSPSTGKKVRALSDSSITELEKSHRQMPEAQMHIPAQGFHSAHEFRSDPAATLERRQRMKDVDRSKVHSQGYEHKQAALSPFSQRASEPKHTTGSPSPMEVDNSNNTKPTEGSSRQMEHSGLSHSQQTSVGLGEGDMVSSSISSLVAFHTPEKSPKMYWLRRHSDSHMPEAEADEQMTSTSGVEASRSQSMGDAEKLEKSPALSSDQGVDAKVKMQDAALLQGSSDKPSSVSPTSSLPKSPTGHAIFTERIKLKKYLQKRYQSSLDEESGLKEDYPRKSGEAEMRGKKDDSSLSEDMSVDKYGMASAMAPPIKKPPSLSLQETVPLKVEPISPPSESDTEAETPVFFSPSFVSPRVFSDSPRWCHNVFQFPTTRGHQVSSQSTESRAPSRREGSSLLETKDVSMEGPPSSPQQQQPQQQQQQQQEEEWISEKTATDEGICAKGEQGQTTKPSNGDKMSSSEEGRRYTKSMQGISVDVQHSAHFSSLMYRMTSIKTRGHPAMGRSRSEGHMPSRPLSPILQVQRASSPATGLRAASASTFLSQQEQLRISGYASGEGDMRKSQMSPQSGYPSVTGQHSLVPHSQLSPSQYTSQSVHPSFSSYMASSPTFSARPIFQWSPQSQEMTTSQPQVSQESDTIRQLPAHFRSLPPPTCNTATGSSGSTSRRTDPSKMICCPFGDKIREQRLSQDPSSVFRCPVCSQLFPSYYYLANHMVNHLPSEVVSKGPGDSNKIHLCKVCNRAFSRSDMLTRHMRLHTGLKPYECHTCGQVFSRSDHLHTHQRTHTGEKPYKCPQCPYAAPRRDMITRHMRIHMKHFTRRGRRSSSTSSDITPQSSTESAEVKRRNQSLSSIDSLESDQSSFRQSSTASTDPEHPDILLEEDRVKGRNWSLTSAESIESTSDVIPSTSSSRHWSAASAESTESYMAPSPSYLPTESEEASSPSVSLASTGTISTDVHMSFQKCAVTSDKDNSSSSSDRDKSSPASVTMEGCTHSSK